MGVGVTVNGICKYLRAQVGGGTQKCESQVTTSGESLGETGNRARGRMGTDVRAGEAQGPEPRLAAGLTSQHRRSAGGPRSPVLTSTCVAPPSP